MTYIPPLPQYIQYEFRKAYEVPTGCNVYFSITDSVIESRYTPRGCTDIWFNHDGIYEIPYSCNVIFSVGESQDVDNFGFTYDKVELFLNVESLLTFSGSMVVPKNINMIINAGTEKVDPLWPINISSTKIEINFNGEGIEILPDMINKSIIINNEISDSIIRGTQPFYLPSSTGSELGKSSWKDGTNADKHSTYGWDKSTDTGIKIVSRIIESSKIDRQIINPWMTLFKYDRSVSSSASQMKKNDTGYTCIWESFLTFDRQCSYPVNSMENNDTWFSMDYLSPDRVYREIRKPVDSSSEKTKNFGFGYTYPKPNDLNKSTAWGPFSYFTLCNEDYKAPEGSLIKFAFPNKYELMPNMCSDISFHVNNYMTADPRCTYFHNHSGVRDKYTWVDPDNKNLTYPMDLGVYHMLNTVFVEEVITGTPIEILHVDAKIDINSWLWSFNVTVASKCFLDIIKPKDGILGNIKITMNGHIFFCTVESWNENRSFGSQAWTITGRSPSLCFGAPMSDAKNKVITTGKQGSTVFDDYMIGRNYPIGWPFQSWEVDFSSYIPSENNLSPTSSGFQPSYNWFLPGNTISYSEKTDIDFLKELASSIGAYIQTSPTTSDGLKDGKSKFLIKPRFSHQPWTWNSENKSIKWKTINESICSEIGRSSESKTEYQAVNVIGESLRNNSSDTGAETTSLYVNVVRNGFDDGSNDGTSGKRAPMVTNKYITHQKAAAENGRMILASGGEWTQHSLRIGVVCSDGLYSVGDMISVMERGTPWYGQVTGVAIAAVTAGSGFAIEQTLDVEEYGGN